MAMDHAPLLLALDDSDVYPGWIALGIVVALGVGLWLLLRSLNTQLGKIDFDDTADDAGAPADEATDPHQPPR